MVAGHWTPELVRIGGGDPVLGPDGRPTGPTSWESIAAARPEVVLIAPCGFRVEQTLREIDALERQPEFRELPAVRAGRVAILDGNAYFNRPGPRLVESAELAALAIHPARFAGAFEHGREDLVRWDELAAEQRGSPAPPEAVTPRPPAGCSRAGPAAS
jgi:iron complex transport system substrate-binding protein